MEFNLPPDQELSGHLDQFLVQHRAKFQAPVRILFPGVDKGEIDYICVTQTRSAVLITYVKYKCKLLSIFQHKH